MNIPSFLKKKKKRWTFEETNTIYGGKPRKPNPSLKKRTKPQSELMTRKEYNEAQKVLPGDQDPKIHKDFIAEKFIYNLTENNRERFFGKREYSKVLLQGKTYLLIVFFGFRGALGVSKIVIDGNKSIGLTLFGKPDRTPLDKQELDNFILKLNTGLQGNFVLFTGSEPRGNDRKSNLSELFTRLDISNDFIGSISANIAGTFNKTGTKSRTIETNNRRSTIILDNQSIKIENMNGKEMRIARAISDKGLIYFFHTQ